MAVSQTTAPTTRVTANSSHWGISKSNHNHRTPVECPFWTINSAAATAASAPTSRPHRNGRRFSIERRSSANVWSRSVGSPISCHRLWSRCLLGFSAFAHRIAQCPARDGFARCSSQPRTERGAWSLRFHPEPVDDRRGPPHHRQDGGRPGRLDARKGPPSIGGPEARRTIVRRCEPWERPPHVDDPYRFSSRGAPTRHSIERGVRRER